VCGTVFYGCKNDSTSTSNFNCNSDNHCNNSCRIYLLNGNKRRDQLPRVRSSKHKNSSWRKAQKDRLREESVLSVATPLYSASGSPSGLGEKVVPPGQRVATYGRHGNHMDRVDCSFFGKSVDYVMFALSIPLVVFHSLQVSHYHGTAVAMSHNINNCGSYRNSSYSSFNTTATRSYLFVTRVTNWK
jgi:hypothetical protein